MGIKMCRGWRDVLDVYGVLGRPNNHLTHVPVQESVVEGRGCELVG
jgi:hypothetical protein